MQASQIDPAKLYAVRIYDGDGPRRENYVARFKVQSVESRMHRTQLKPNASNYTHKINGLIDERDVPPDLLPDDPAQRAAYLKRSIDPAQIEDEYESFKGLKDRAAAEKAKAEAEAAARKANVERLVALFYQFTGLTPSKENPAFQAQWTGRELLISQEGCIALFKVLTPNQPAADK